MGSSVSNTIHSQTRPKN